MHAAAHARTYAGAPPPLPSVSDLPFPYRRGPRRHSPAHSSSLAPPKASAADRIIDRYASWPMYSDEVRKRSSGAWMYL